MTTTILAYIPSPSQGVWHIWIIPIRAYALCIIAGIVAALTLGDRRWEARGGERGVIYDIALWAVPFGLIGGRLYHVMTDWPKYFGPDGAGFLAALRIWDGGLGIWGAVALGGVGAWIACRRRGIPLPAFADAIAPGIILAQAIGRFGNYFNQELYGRQTDLPWGLTIYDRLDPSGVVSPHSLEGVSTGQVYSVVHPTFLYELLWNLLIFAMLIWADRRFTLGHARLFALYVAGYCVGRFWVELMRDDPASLIAGIRVNSFTSTFVFIGAVIYIMVAPKGREDPATLRGKRTDQSVLDQVGEELVAVAATSGVVAAAKVAGDEDKAESTAPSADPPDEPDASLGAVEGDDAVVAVAAAPEVREAAVEGAEKADAVADEGGAEAESAGPTEEPSEESSEAPESSTEEAAPEVESAEPSESSADGSTEGLGSVDGDEAAAAEEAAPEVHEAAVEGAEKADEVAAEAEPAEPSTESAEDPAASVDGAEKAEAAADVVAEEEPSAESADDATEGLGSVDGDEVAAAEQAAPDLHEAAVDGAEKADAVADEVAAEAEPTEPNAESTKAPESSAEVPEADAESSAATGEPNAGLGAVEGDEAVAAELATPEVHQAAVEGAQKAEAMADEVMSAAPSVPVEEATPGAADENSRRRWWRRG